MTIYRNKHDDKLYTIEHIILDIKHLNNNEFAGIEAVPYLEKGDNIVLRSKDKTICERFVEQNFIYVSEF